MRLSSLYVQNLRIIENVEISTDADLIVFTGLNGSGKTSLLEAIHLLGTGRSFRTHKVSEVVRHQSDTLVVRGQVKDRQERESSVGIEKTSRGGTRFRINGNDVHTSSALAHHMPLVVVTPDSQRMLTDGAQIRRKLIDWLMFHVEPDYNQLHQRYRRALKQRNTALRQVSSEHQHIWNQELGTTGQALHLLRVQHLEKALVVLSEVFAQLLKIHVRIDYQPGWDTDIDLGNLLNTSWQQDFKRGFTGSGPHRADLGFFIENNNARHILSRGESKLLTVAVLIGMAKLLTQTIGQTPVLLVDELASELDHENRELFFNALKATGAQTFVTTVSDELVNAPGWSQTMYYQVVHGELRKC